MKRFLTLLRRDPTAALLFVVALGILIGLICGCIDSAKFLAMQRQQKNLRAQDKGKLK